MVKYIVIDDKKNPLRLRLKYKKIDVVKRDTFVLIDGSKHSYEDYFFMSIYETEEEANNAVLKRNKELDELYLNKGEKDEK